MKSRILTHGSLIAVALFGVSVQSAQLMHTHGELAVNDRGGAVFTIPLALPPKPGAADPVLSLVYKSQSGNGLFGVGWALAGLPSITRCTKNVAEEGTRVGVKNDASDLFCLNGEKLRVTSGAYGADGSQYRTANESYARITSFGVAGAGPRWFRVEQKNGQILEFGNTDDARLELPSAATTRVWMVNAIMDRSTNGNATRYTYQKDLALGEQVLASMQFTNGYVEIEYEARPSDDLVVAYANGVQLGSTSKRGKTFRVYSEPLIGGVPTRQLFKEYRLLYTQSAATRRSLLASVTECGPGGASAVCLGPTRLSYQNTLLDDIRLSPIAGPGSGFNISIDVKGNGKEELMGFSSGGPVPPGLATGSGNTLGGYAVWDHNADGLVDVEFTVIDFRGDERQLLSYSDGVSLTSGVAVNDLYWCHADFDGDGRTEAISRSLTGREPNLTLSRAVWSGTSFANSPINVATSTRDEFQRIVGSMDICLPVDFNGDGRAELVTKQPGTGGSYEGYTVDFSAAQNISSLGAFTGFGSVLMFGDFNADGKTDIVANSMPPRIWLSSGVGFPSVATSPPDSTISLQYSCVGDFNGDGRSDTFDSNNGNFLLSVSNGFVRIPSGMGQISGTQAICGDFNGDGKAEIYAPSTGVIWAAAKVGAVDYLSRIDFGSGKAAQIEYKPLTDSAVYAKGTGGSFPIVDVQNSMYVVSRKLESTGRGSFAPVAYAYSGARSNLQSNGLLGFETITSLNELSRVAVRTTYRQDYPYVGLPSQVQKYVGGQNLELSTHTYQAFDQTAQYARVHHTAVTTRRWDLNGAFISWARDTDSDFDLYGNARARLIEHFDSGGVTAVSRQSTATTYLNDTTRWLIGLPMGVTANGMVSNAPISAALGTPDTPAPTQPPSATAAALSIASMDWSFGSVKDNVLATQVLTVANVGDLGAPLNISSSNSRFGIARTTCPAQGGTIAGHSSCTITVSFRGEGRCGGTITRIPVVITASAGNSTVTSSGNASDWVYKMTDPICR